jgi:hypothetical protein
VNEAHQAREYDIVEAEAEAEAREALDYTTSKSAVGASHAPRAARGAQEAQSGRYFPVELEIIRKNSRKFKFPI